MGKYLRRAHYSRNRPLQHIPHRPSLGWPTRTEPAQEEGGCLGIEVFPDESEVIGYTGVDEDGICGGTA